MVESATNMIETAELKTFEVLERFGLTGEVVRLLTTLWNMVA